MKTPRAHNDKRDHEKMHVLTFTKKTWCKWFIKKAGNETPNSRIMGEEMTGCNHAMVKLVNSTLRAPSHTKEQEPALT